MKKRKNVLKDGIEIAIIVVVMYLIFQFVLMSVRVSGISMEPTYLDGERGIMLRTSSLNKPKIGDVVVVDGKNAYGIDEGLVVKRVFAMGKDKVAIKNNKIYVNGKVVPDPYLDKDYKMDDMDEIQLLDDEIFILGDNRKVSLDSRAVGPIKLSDVKAVHGLMFWPLNKIGIMN